MQIFFFFSYDRRKKIGKGFNSMKYSAPKTMSLLNGKKAVLLLHSFTGSTIDMRKLGKYLFEEGYSVYCPMYTGHGEAAETLLSFGPDTWWNDVREAYEHLEDEGYEEIAVIGLSLGAVLALKVATELNPIGVVTMSLPMGRDEVILRKRVIFYARNRQQYEELTEEEKEENIAKLKQHPMGIIPQFIELITEQVGKIPEITVPSLAMCGDLDDAMYRQSAEHFIEVVGSSKKSMKHYKHTGHLMTYSEDAKEIYADIKLFLDELEWSN